MMALADVKGISSQLREIEGLFPKNEVRHEPLNMLRASTASFLTAFNSNICGALFMETRLGVHI